MKTWRQSSAAFATTSLAPLANAESSSRLRATSGLISPLRK
jgi:hypothetical protein